MMLRYVQLSTLALTLLCACNPRSFDDVVGVRGDAAVAVAREDAAVAVAREDAAAAAEPDATAVAEPDAGLGPVPAHDAGDSAVAAQEPPALPLDDASCPQGRTLGAPLNGVGRFVELARVREPYLSGRVLGPSVQIDNRRTWLFSRRLLPTHPSEEAPVAARDSDAQPWARSPETPDVPWALDVSRDATGTPSPFVALLDSESAMDSVVLAPFSAVHMGEKGPGALVFGIKTFGWLQAEVFLAELAPKASSAQRRAEPLFSRQEPQFALGAFRGITMLKVFACSTEKRDGQDYGSCKVAGAPRDQADQRSAYKVWGRQPDGRLGWLDDISQGEPVIQDVGGDLSVSFNAHLRKFVAVHSPSPRGSQLILQTADAVEGPWTRVAAVELPRSLKWTTRAREQVGLEQRCGARIIVSYFDVHQSALLELQGNSVEVPVDGEVVLGAVDLL